MKKLLLLSWSLLLLCVTQLYAQDRTITGKVTAQSDGLPLPGVAVTIKGTTTGTQTDSQGNFTLTGNANAKVLVFTYIGFKQKEVVITSGTMSVVLEESNQSLSEVIVTGYTTQNKREVTGSVASVKADQVAVVPIGSFDQALQGRAPGVSVIANSGQPGASAVITIRGRGTVSGSTNPLYILDGIEITAREFATMNPNDFASFSILKDAVSTQPYGSRGANGVVVITSKQGQIGRPIIRYDLQLGKSKAPENKLKVMNTEQKLDYELANGNPYEWSDEDLAELRTVDTDWEKVFVKNGITKSHNLSISGGADRTKYFISGSLFDQSGTVPTTKLKRYNGRANISSGTKDFDFGLTSSIGYSNFSNTSEANASQQSPLNAIRWTNPYLTVYNPDGTYMDNPSGQANAFANILENTNDRGQLKAVGTIYGLYRVPVVPGLFAKVNGGADYVSNEGTIFTDPITQPGRQATGSRGSLNRTYNRYVRYTLTSSLGYSKKIGTDHNVSLALYNEMVKYSGRNFGFTGFGLGGAFENESGITPGTSTNNFIPTVTGNAATNALLSYFTTINYSYKDRYYLQLGGRRDGSSKFGSNFRYANFGSVGASWVVSSEPFFVPIKDVVSDFKYKISYGSAGNQSALEDFASRELYGRSVYNGTSGLGQSQLASPNLTWEQRNTFNTGIEFTLFKGRIGGTLEYYNALTTKLLFPQALSLTTGYSSFNANVGEMRNKGIEASLNADIIKSKSFNWNAFVNFTYNKNTVEKLYDGVTQLENANGLYLSRPGDAFTSLFLVRYAGVNPDNGNSIYFDKDGNQTETYNVNDRVVVGTADAPYFGGFGSVVTYKGIELNFLFSFVKGNELYNSERYNLEEPSYLVDNLSVDMLNEWRTPGQITNIPRADQGLESGTTRFVEEGDFLRLRNVTLSYDFPKKLVSKIKVNSLRLFVQGQNLKTWTKFKGWDPELTDYGLAGAQYPALRTITAGLSVGF